MAFASQMTRINAPPRFALWTCVTAAAGIITSAAVAERALGRELWGISGQPGICAGIGPVRPVQLPRISKWSKIRFTSEDCKFM